ncbi:hypothetical protein IWW39_002085 [Coemansia spiralis]|uniref:Uncharacterized protein n=1 Tax=Coemansia spiralis TaxID=417178 RepID=A0A9W8L3X3_9FUNG|nr:hypothetical protein IWW39_002085 [Coemansia spiralis]
MKTITSAILPRRRRLTNDSTNAKASAGPHTYPSKLSISEELPARHLRRLHSGSTTTIDSTTAAEEPTAGLHDTRDHHGHKRDQRSLDLDYGVATDAYLSEGIPVVVATRPMLERSSSASLYESMHYQPLYEDVGYDGVPVPTIRRRKLAAAPAPRSHDMGISSGSGLRIIQPPAAAAASVAEPKSGLLSYVNRLPFLGFGRHSSSSSSSKPSLSEPPATASASEDVGRQMFDHDALPGQQYLHGPSLMSESMVEPSNSSFFSVDYGLLKRVSSTPGNLSLFRAHLVDPFSHPEFRAPPRYTRHQPIRLPANEPDDTPLYGYALLALTSVLFMFSMYSLVVSKYMPDTGIEFLDAIKRDRYYCLLMPITGLSFTFAVFWNWLGMKLFRHSKGS